ncbi:MAG TPA: hypothetical protein VE684_03215, partial [Crenalkalicoccus sp.]|nr:hypothetical protein [Crenalkalicoccus sp.]
GARRGGAGGRGRAGAIGPPNPALRLDPTLGLVVIQCREGAGTAQTIPSERQLDAYRYAARTAHEAPGAALPPVAKAGEVG